MSAESSFVSSIAQVVDAPQKQFEQEIIDQHVNVGQLQNMVILLESIYGQLCVQKDMVVNSVTRGERSKDDPQVKSTLEGLYAEMTKIELKVTFLKDRRKELIPGLKTLIDTFSQVCYSVHSESAIHKTNRKI